MTKFEELVLLFKTDPSEALYRGEEELTGDEFVRFVNTIVPEDEVTAAIAAEAGR